MTFAEMPKRVSGLSGAGSPGPPSKGSAVSAMPRAAVTRVSASAA